METTKILIASSFGLLALLHQLIKFIRRRRLFKTYFKNKNVLITGASSGLGAALAEELYPLGAQLILCARRLDELNNVKTKLIKSQKKCMREPEVICLDVTASPDVIKDKLDSIVTKHGCIDILINNAGISYRGESYTTSQQIFQKIMDVNYFGAIKMTNQVVEYMIAENKKNAKSNYKSDFSIVQVGSVQSLLSVPYRSAYSASKHALLAYSDALRSELHENSNIQVISTYPGYINTNISMNALRDTGEVNKINDDDHRYAYSPNYVAIEILKAIIDRNKEAFISVFLHKVAVWIRFFTPNVYHYIMRRRALNKSKEKYT